LAILIENGTSNEGLAGRIGTVLEQNGFWNVEVATTENPGSQDETEIVDNEGNLGTSALITNLIGVGADRIAIGNLPGTETNGPGDGTQGNQMGSQYAIVITLGGDAPDPAGSEWNLSDYQREVGDEPVDAPQGTPPGDSSTDGTTTGDGTDPGMVPGDGTGQ